MLMALALLACAPGDPARPTPMWKPGGADFWDVPWPLDTRRDPDGTLDLVGFPNPYDTPLLDDYLAWAEQIEGFGTNAPIYVPFAQAVDPLTLPTPIESVADPEAGVFLVDVDPGSPGFAGKVPIQWEVRDDPDSFYLPEHLLAVAPVYGFPLRPRTRYALVVTREVADPAPGFAEVWDPIHPNHGVWADLLDTLPLLGLSPDDVAIAAPFTTRDPLDELARIAWFVRERTGLPDLDLDLEYVATFSRALSYRTHYPSPVFTHGERPYSAEGGGFRWGDDGNPLIASWDDMRLAVCTPLDLSEPPPTGWPVVIFQHGTGGDYRGYCDYDGLLEVANQLGVTGLVGLGIDQPLHGPRGSGSDLDHFNLMNPESGVTNFRQGAIDAIYLAHALHDRPWTMTTPEGQAVPLDPERVLFMGHSQGGLTGGLAAPFFGEDVDAVMLSGAGGVLAITVIVRKDVIDFEQLVAGVLQLPEDEELTTLYPVMGLIQTAAEVTDPVNYAPYWFAQRGNWDFQEPVPVLLTSGTLDAATPYQTAIALAAAGRLPILRPQITSSVAHDLRGLPRERDPLIDNAVAWDGTRVSAAFSQWRDGSHWVVFEEPDAAELYRYWLETAAEGRPIATRPTD